MKPGRCDEMRAWLWVFMKEQIQKNIIAKTVIVAIAVSRSRRHHHRRHRLPSCKIPFGEMSANCSSLNKRTAGTKCRYVCVWVCALVVERLFNVFLGMTMCFFASVCVCVCFSYFLKKEKKWNGRETSLTPSLRCAAENKTYDFYFSLLNGNKNFNVCIVRLKYSREG